MASREERAARILWSYLKNGRLGSYWFEWPGNGTNNAEATFYCQEVRLAVVVEGPVLSEPTLTWKSNMRAYQRLLATGVVMLRFHPDRILYRTDEVLSLILGALRERHQYWMETVIRSN